MKKKLLALFLALVMVGAVLPGCGDGSKDPGGQGNNGKTGEPVKGGEITGNDRGPVAHQIAHSPRPNAAHCPGD